MPEGAASGDARGIFGATCVRLTLDAAVVARMCHDARLPRSGGKSQIEILGWG